MPKRARSPERAVGKKARVRIRPIAPLIKSLRERELGSGHCVRSPKYAVEPFSSITALGRSRHTQLNALCLLLSQRRSMEGIDAAQPLAIIWSVLSSDIKAQISRLFYELFSREILTATLASQMLHCIILLAEHDPHGVYKSLTLKKVLEVLASSNLITGYSNEGLVNFLRTFFCEKVMGHRQPWILIDLLRQSVLLADEELRPNLMHQLTVDYENRRVRRENRDRLIATLPDFVEVFSKSLPYMRFGDVQALLALFADLRLVMSEMLVIRLLVIALMQRAVSFMHAWCVIPADRIYSVVDHLRRLGVAPSDALAVAYPVGRGYADIIEQAGQSRCMVTYPHGQSIEGGRIVTPEHASRALAMLAWLRFVDCDSSIVKIKVALPILARWVLMIRRERRRGAYAAPDHSSAFRRPGSPAPYGWFRDANAIVKLGSLVGTIALWSGVDRASIVTVITGALAQGVAQEAEHRKYGAFEAATTAFLGAEASTAVPLMRRASSGASSSLFSGIGASAQTGPSPSPPSSFGSPSWM